MISFGVFLVAFSIVNFWNVFDCYDRVGHMLPAFWMQLLFGALLNISGFIILTVNGGK